MARMTRDQMTRWGARYDITGDQAMKLRRLVDVRFRLDERATNGDPHRNVKDREDKNANAQAWEAELAIADAALIQYAEAIGFDDVDFTTGMVPTLKKGDEKWIMPPD